MFDKLAAKHGLEKNKTIGARLLEGPYKLEERGPIEVKGKGTMTTYLLVA